MKSLLIQLKFVESTTQSLEKTVLICIQDIERVQNSVSLYDYTEEQQTSLDDTLFALYEILGSVRNFHNRTCDLEQDLLA